MKLHQLHIMEIWASPTRIRKRAGFSSMSCSTDRLSPENSINPDRYFETEKPNKPKKKLKSSSSG
jgi:hypothetical protein